MNDVRIVAEAGINHNGDINIAKQLILTAKAAGCDYVKFQKRTPPLCVPKEQQNVIKQTPWGEMTYLEYKERVEFDEDQYSELFLYARSLNIEMFASVWDLPSVDFMSRFTQIGKIPSALITNIPLLQEARRRFKTLIISTGMSTEEEIKNAYSYGLPDVVMHTNSSYPAPMEELNLRYITQLHNIFPKAEIGYSGHEYGLVGTFAAVVLGATWVERHITLDHNMWGSDQSSSIEPSGLFKLVRGIRDIEKATQYEPQQRLLFKGELNKRKTLRG